MPNCPLREKYHMKYVRVYYVPFMKRLHTYLQKFDGPSQIGCTEFDSHEVHTPKVFISLCNALIRKSY